MSLQANQDPVLTSMEQAEKELALYAAIIGHRPTVDHMAAPAPAESAQPAVDHISHAYWIEHKQRLTIWMRQMSVRAKRRIGEAKTRLAS